MDFIHAFVYLLISIITILVVNVCRHFLNQGH